MTDIEKIKQLMQTYFDGLYACDTDLLMTVFHESALYAYMEDGELITRSMQEYLPIVSQRISPQSRGDMRQDKIIAIDITGSSSALVKANCSIHNRYFTDYLSLLKVNQQWKIISKVFHFELIEI